MAWIRDDLQGKTFGRLEVIHRVKSSRWGCKCTCGNTCVVLASHLLSGNKKSCGCLKRTVLGNATRTHGRSNSRVSGYKDRTYGIWQAMRDRCTNPNRADWNRYGGAGVTYDPSWDSFEQFVADMGNAPTGLTIDRIDGSEGYSPTNCRWATYKEQSLNSSKATLYTKEGVTDSISGWARRLNISRTKALKLLE